MRCGTVRVPRDPARPEGGHFDLSVVVKRSAAPKPGAAPVLILHGGPGGEQVRFMGRGAKDFVPGRDTVAFDMRGGGLSGPAVCKATPAALAAATRQALAGQDAKPARLAALAACEAETQAAGLLPEHFGTERNVGDAEAIRQALGVAKWALYGGSYGTAVAADYVARHPQAIESAVLDSLYPPDEFVPPVRVAQGRAMGHLLGECAAEPACAQRFPGLTPAVADAALTELAAEPLAFSFNGQRYTADELAVRIALLGLFYNEDTARTVPWFLNAVRQRDGQAIASMLAMPLYAGDSAVISSVSILGLMATDCRDRARHHAPDAGTGPSWMGLFVGLQSDACGGWTLGTPPALPVGTQVPMLVLSAGYDGFQPDGAAVAKAIGPAATAFTVPYAAHGVRGAGECPRGLITRFIEQPTQALDASCLTRMKPPAFLMDAAPRPQWVATAFRAQAGEPPAALLVAGAGLLLWLLAGVIVPVLRWGWRRWRGGTVGTHTAHLPLAAFGAGLLGAMGVAVPLAGTFMGNPGAAAYGVDAALAPVLWALPLAGMGGVLVAALAVRQGRWMVLAAGLAVAVWCLAS